MDGVDQLAPERKKAQFDVDEMKIVWAGSRHAFQVSDRIARLVASDPVYIYKKNKNKNSILVSSIYPFSFW